MQEDPGNIKGLVIRQFLGWYVGRYGMPRAKAALDAMPAEHREIIDLSANGFGILPTRWYSASFVHAMLDAAIAPFDSSTHEDVASEAAQAIITGSISGIYKTLFRLVATPDRYMKYQQKVWDQHYDSGTIEIERVSATSHRVITRGWRGHHPFSCKLNNAAAVPIHENMGKKHVTSRREQCISEGADACTAIVAWTD